MRLFPAVDRPAIGAILALLLACATAPLLAATKPDDAEEVQIADGLSAMALTEGAWVVTSAAPWPANVLVVRMSDGSVVLADTPPNEAWTAAVLDWIDRRLSPTRVIAVNSHYHADAAGGNRVLIERGI
ncbi:MAG: hypothetical protein MI919_11530, partial [Holophagales bacterium]|nr:hypothetical protein [Holophagales bacterium]